MIKNKFSVTKENYTIFADASLMNKDLVVTLYGGNVPHIGGVVTYDYKSLKVEKIYFDSHDDRKHKDIFLAEEFIHKVKKELPGNTCVSAGVHIDGITKKQIDASFVMVDTLAQKVLDWVKENIHNTIDPKYITHLQRDAQGNLKE